MRRAVGLPAATGRQDRRSKRSSAISPAGGPLIVLDNCEHLVDDVAKFVESLLAATREVDIVATSREPLAIGGELRWQVPSLGGREADEAVELFVDRAASLVSGFELTADNRTDVQTICRQLDGIPLAIELAVGRLTMLTPAQLADHLDDRFRLLAGGSRTAVGRQRTLLGMMDWSHDLLSSSERVLLRRLSVFVEASISSRCRRSAGLTPVAPLEVFERLGRLVDESMVQFERDLTPATDLGRPRRRDREARPHGRAHETSARLTHQCGGDAAGIEALIAAGDIDAALQLGRLEMSTTARP